MRKLGGLILLILLPLQILFAADDFYHFNNSQEEARFQNLTTELRCLVCQNQNIAESNAGLASDLRDSIYQQIIAGHSDKEIVDYLVARYGNFILYKPPVNGLTIGLWLGPILLLCFGLGYLFVYIRREQKA